MNEFKLSPRSGFTLIEISIVIVIIGLIVGGIIIGKTLMDSARIRAQVRQIEEYQTAVKTFELKYNHLPGDIPEPDASGFGLLPRGAGAGQGDGNGMVQMFNSTLQGVGGGGEFIVFWDDLSRTNLIPEKLTAKWVQAYVSTVYDPTHLISTFFPAAKINSKNNYISLFTRNGQLYFSLTSFDCSTCQISSDGSIHQTWGLKVIEAYNIDQKIDDGFPQTGKVKAELGGIWWAGSFSSWYGGQGLSGTNTTAWPESNASCFDNGNVSGKQHEYSLTVDKGEDMNCSLSFRY